ncbi:MAG: hypothetical protein ACTSX8_03595 [Alphaproteobacteria bacterium]
MSARAMVEARLRLGDTAVGEGISARQAHGDPTAHLYFYNSRTLCGIRRKGELGHRFPLSNVGKLGCIRFEYLCGDCMDALGGGL